MADILTNSLAAPRMEELRKMLNLMTTQAEVEEVLEIIVFDM